MKQQQSDSFFFLFQEHDQPSWIVSLSDFVIQDVNKTALQILKIKRDKFLQSSLEELFPSDWEKIKRMLRKKVKGDSNLGTLHYQRKAYKGVLQKVKIKRVKFNNRPCCLITASVQVPPHKVNKKIELELVMQKELSNTIINNLPGVFYLFDENGKLLLWNKNFETVTGYSGKEVRNMIVTDFFEEPEKTLIFETIGNAFVYGNADVAAHFLTKHKTRIPYHFDARLVKFDGKRCLIGLGIDITKLKETEKEREELLKRFEKISDNIPGFIYEFRMRKDGSTHFPFASKGITEIYGLTPDDVKHDSAVMFSLVHPDDIASLNTEIQNGAKTLKPRGAEFRSKAANGKFIWIRTSTTMESFADGSLIWYGYAEDITASKEVSLLLKEKEEQVTLMTDNIPRGAIFQVKEGPNTEPKLTFISQGITEIVGRTPSAILDNRAPILKSIHSDDRERVTKMAMGALFNKLPFNEEFRIVTLKGDEHWVKVISRPRKSAPEVYLWDGLILDISEQKLLECDRRQAELKLERTAKRLELATKSAGLGIWQIDFVNDVWEPDERLREILGIQETTITREAYMALMHPADREKKRQRDKEKMSGEGTQYFDEYRIIRPIDQEIRYLKSRGAFLRGAKGEPTGGISVVYDQTKEKQDTLSLQETKDRLERVITSIREGIWEMDLETDTFYTSSGWKEMYGYNDEDLKDFSANWQSFIHPDDVTYVAAVFGNAMRGIQPTYDFEYRATHKDGHFKWSRIRCLVTADSNGKPIKITGSTEDISERKKMEKNLAESESHLRTILHAEPECVKLLDSNGSLMDMNPAGLAMIEADSLEQVKGAKVIDLIKPEYRAAFMELNKDAFKGKSGNLTFEIVGLKGTSRWLESNVVPLLDGAGKPTAALGVTRDVTEYKMYEAELLASNQEKDILIKEIHHRVKNNLQLISSMLYLKMLDDSNWQSRDFMTTIREKIKSISLIHERLLQTESLNAIDIQDYLQKLLHDIQVTYHRQDLELDIQADIQSLTFSTDYATSLGQLVNELVINAMKHAFVKATVGRIMVSLCRNGNDDSFTLTIQDNGIGLPPELDPATAKSYGMQLLQIFVKQLKGKLEISNDAGTRYRIDFKI